MPRIRFFTPAGDDDAEGHIARSGRAACPKRVEDAGEADVELLAEGHAGKIKLGIAPAGEAEAHMPRVRIVELANEVIDVVDDTGGVRRFLVLDDEAEGHKKHFRIDEADEAEGHAAKWRGIEGADETEGHAARGKA